MQVSMYKQDMESFGYMLRMVLLDHMVVLVLAF